MVPEFWLMGEDLQDKVRHAGYEAEEVEGIAVDIHDVLQAADRIREELAPKLLACTPEEMTTLLKELAFEFDHIRWHCDSATAYLEAAQSQLAK